MKRAVAQRVGTGPRIEFLEGRRLLAGVGLDTSFAGPTGRDVIQTATAADLRGTSAAAMLIQPDGKVVVAGLSGDGGNGAAMVTRLNADGSVDTSFGTGGTDFFRFSGTTTVTAARLLGNGRLVFAGELNGVGGYVARLNADGSLDTTFGTGGHVQFGGLTGVLNSAQDLIVLPDDKLLVGGDIALTKSGVAASNAAVARFNADGSLDTTFGTSGRVVYDQGISFTQGLSGMVQLSPTRVMAITPTGLAIIDPVAGAIVSKIVTSTTSAGGVVPSRLITLPDGHVAAIGTYVPPTGGGYSVPAIARFNGDGTLDTTFGTGGLTKLANYTSYVAVTASAFVRQADGSYLVALTNSPLGHNSVMNLTRVSVSGAVDTTFGGSGTFLDPLTNGSAAAYSLPVTNAAIDAQGRLVVAAASRYGPMPDGGNTTDNVIVSRYVVDTNIAPVVTLPTGALKQGDALPVSAAGTTATLPIVKYEWDQDYRNNTFDVDATGQDATLKAVLATTQTVALRVTTSDGASEIFIRSLSVADVAPTVTPGPAISGAVNQAVPLAFTVIDPGTESFSVSVNVNGASTTFSNWTPAKVVTAVSAYAGDTVARVTVYDSSGLSTSVNIPFHVTPLTGRVVDATSGTGLAGVTLFIDKDRDGVLDTGETTFVTDADGNYVLPPLANGSYQFGIVAPSGYAFPGKTSDLQFGLYQSAMWTGGVLRLSRAAVATGTLYDDQNGDGVADNGMTPVVGATVWADLNNNGTLDANEPSATTDAAGVYALTLGDPGTYTLRTLATPAFDVEAASNATVTVSNAQRSTVNLVAKKREADCILDVVTYLDANGNGVLDTNEQIVTNLPARFVYAAYPTLTPIPTVSATVNTASTSIGLHGQAIGNIIVSLALSPGFQLASGSATQTATLSGEAIATVMYAIKYAPDAGVITGHAYDDLNASGQYDSGDTLLQQTVYDDLNNNGVLDPGEPQTYAATGASAYQLFGVPPGPQVIRVYKGGNYAYSGGSAGVSVNVPAGQTVGGIDFRMVNTNRYTYSAGILGATQIAQGQTTLLSGYGQLENATGIGFEWDLDYVPGGPFTVDQTGYSITYGTNATVGPHLIAGRAYDEYGRRSSVALFTVNVVGIAPAWLSAGNGATYTLSGSTLSVTAGTVTLLSDARATQAGLNVSVSGTGQLVVNTTQHLGSLILADNASVTMIGSGHLLRATTLSIGDHATLDLGANDLLYDDAGTSPATTVRDLIASAYAAGAWTGTGLTSTAAKNDATRSTTLGYLTASDYFAANGASAAFDGETVDSTAVLVRYTLYGDSNLDRGVNIIDFNSLAVAFGMTGTTWAAGDFDNDAATSISDFNQLATNFGKSLTAANAVTGSSAGAALVPPKTLKTAILRGYAFNDRNSNGRFDGHDTYAAGTRVYLDLNGDGVLDGAEPSVLTDKSGQFTFKNLAAGTYRVREVLAKGHAATTGKLNVTLASGQAKTGLAIGTKTT